MFERFIKDLNLRNPFSSGEKPKDKQEMVAPFTLSPTIQRAIITRGVKNRINLNPIPQKDNVATFEGRSYHAFTHEEYNNLARTSGVTIIRPNYAKEEN